jgi:hypothetical protein
VQSVTTQKKGGGIVTEFVYKLSCALIASHNDSDGLNSLGAAAQSNSNFLQFSKFETEKSPVTGPGGL